MKTLMRNFLYGLILSQWILFAWHSNQIFSSYPKTTAVAEKRENQLTQTAESIVTSKEDSGPGSFRSALENARPGTVIRFDPQIFPLEKPATILLKRMLPDLTQGGVTIDAHDVGVILDGSLLGNEPEQAFIDDVSLSLDGGDTILQNGDFNPNLQLNHWRFWQRFDVDNFQWNREVGGREAGSFEWNGTSRQDSFSLIYQESVEPVNLSGEEHGWHQPGEAVFLPLNGAKTITLNFRYRYGNISPNLKFFTADYQEMNLFMEAPFSEDWNVIQQQVDIPEGAVWVALEINFFPTQTSNGLMINSDDNIVQGLQIINFSGNGIVIMNGSRNQIGGVNLEAGCSGVCNLLSGNLGAGLFVQGGGENVIQGNYMGVDVSGTTAFPNGMSSVRIFDSANNRVGGRLSLGEGNLLSGSTMGVEINQAGNEPVAEGNLVQGNLIGTNLDGTEALGNHAGISLAGSSYTLIGGNDPDLRNIISGNEAGVFLSYGAHHNTFLGNYIGTDMTGLMPLGNLNDGINLGDGAHHNQIGGQAPGEGNVISGNQGNGVMLAGMQTSNNLILGNLIGLGADGLAKIPNRFDGIALDKAVNNEIGPANRIFYNGNLGININFEGDLSGNRITQNSISQNQAAGVVVFDGNTPVAPQVSQLVITSRSVDGMTEPDSVVEIYQDSGEEGEIFLASVKSNQEGEFFWVLPAGETLQDNITLLVTDPSGRTSGFSEPSPVPDAFLETIPGSVSPQQISLKPGVIAINTFIAIAALLFFGVVATWFNESLENFSKELMEEIRQFFQKLGFIRHNKGKKQEKKQSLWIVLLKWLIILGITAFIQTFLDPELRFNLTWAGQLATLVLSGLLITGFQILTEWLLRRISVDQPDVKETEVSLVGLGIAAVSVLFSRLMNFSPGIVLGTVDGLYCNPPLDDVRQNGQRALAAKGIVFGITFAGWLLSPLVKSWPGLEALLITMFVVGIQYAFFELIPLKVLDGYAIRSWNKWIWRLAFLISAIGFVYLCINPDLGDLSALRENSMLTLLVMASSLLIMALVLKIVVSRLEKNNTAVNAPDLAAGMNEIQPKKEKTGD